MATKKKTTRRKSTKAPSPAQLRARKAFALAAKARSKASKKKAGKKPVRRNKTIITKPKKVVVINPNRNDNELKAVRAAKAAVDKYGPFVRQVNTDYAQGRISKSQQQAKLRGYEKAIASAVKRASGASGLRYARDLWLIPQYADKRNPSAKSTRRKYRNGYLDLVIMGHAKKTPSGWSLGGKTFKQGKGIVPASKRGYYLDRATGTVFSKKARNAEHRDSEHPIEVTKHFRGGPPGYMTPWQRAHSQGQQGLFDHGIKGAKRKNPGYKKSDKVQDVFRKWHTVYDVRGNIIYTLQGDTVHVTKVIAVKKARRKSAKKNPSVKAIRKEFAGTLGKASTAFAPIGTPRNVAKLGKLLLIDTENATIKPTGIVYLCADSKGKLHLCGSKNVPIYSGAAQSFGRVKKLEYETAKPHLYPGQGVISFWHKMGEESGNQPTLYADGKGGLKFRGGSYKITREGIVD